MLPLIALFLFTGAMTAQDAATALKKAKKALSTANIATDQEVVAKELETARQNIEIAAAGVGELSEKDVYKLWETKADIYNQTSRGYISKRFLDPTSVPAVSDNPAMEAYTASVEGLKVAAKKWQKSKLSGFLLETASYLLNYGGYFYEAQDFKSSYDSFNAGMNARKVLKENGVDDFLPTDEEYNQQVYSTAICASLAGDQEASLALFQQLYDINYPEPAIYDGLFKGKLEKDEAEALTILEKGRELFPDDQGLLVTEINYYLNNGKLEALTGKLKAGIEKDPDNISFITTLGQVYDELGNKEVEAGNAVKAQEYKELAMNYFEQSLAKDPTNYTAMYNIGVIYYNKAAVLTKELVDLESDLSKSGTQKYNAKQKEVYAMFDKALPYFKDAEKIEPNDMGTLIALKEIFAKKDDLATSNEFKARIEKINNQEVIETSFFK